MQARAGAGQGAVGGSGDRDSTGTGMEGHPVAGMDEAIFRCHTMPVRAMAEMVKQLHSGSGALPPGGGLGSPGDGRGGGDGDRTSKASRASSHKSRLGGC